MRKALLALMLLAIALTASACGSGDNSFTDVSYATPNGNFVREWVSPDGVHYWQYGSCGIAPRYDATGQLVIDRQPGAGEQR